MIVIALAGARDYGTPSHVTQPSGLISHRAHHRGVLHRFYKSNWKKGLIHRINPIVPAVALHRFTPHTPSQEERCHCFYTLPFLARLPILAVFVQLGPLVGSFPLFGLKNAPLPARGIMPRGKSFLSPLHCTDLCLEVSCWCINIQKRHTGYPPGSCCCVSE